MSPVTRLLSLASRVLCLSLVLVAPAHAGVYMTNEIDPVSNFCQAVATTKDTYCPRMHVNCRNIKKKKVSFLVKLARQCSDDVSKISNADAMRAIDLFTQQQSSLCCFSLRK